MTLPNSEFDYRLPRLLLAAPLQEGEKERALPDDQGHYLRIVLRRPDGADLRVFHPESGEFLAQFKWAGKKGGTLLIGHRIRPPFPPAFKVHLAFPPIKKDRFDVLIEKAVELGGTHLHPVITSRSIHRELNLERLIAHIREATEQCERLDAPVVSPLVPLVDFLRMWDLQCPLYTALERQDARGLKDLCSSVSGDRGFLVGPEGGFSIEEISLFETSEFCIPVSLGPRILRTETAALYGLSLLNA